MTLLATLPEQLKTSILALSTRRVQELQGRLQTVLADITMPAPHEIAVLLNAHTVVKANLENLLPVGVLPLFPNWETVYNLVVAGNTDEAQHLLDLAKTGGLREYITSEMDKAKAGEATSIEQALFYKLLRSFAELTPETLSKLDTRVMQAIVNGGVKLDFSDLPSSVLTHLLNVWILAYTNFDRLQSGKVLGYQGKP